MLYQSIQTEIDQQEARIAKSDRWKLKAESSAAPLELQQNIRNIPPSMRKRYRLFEDEAEEVLDSAQAQWIEIEAPEEEDTSNEFEGLNLKRKCSTRVALQDVLQLAVISATAQ